MGLSGIDINAVLRLREEGFFSERCTIVEIGAQQLSSDVFEEPGWFEDCARTFGVKRKKFKGPSSAVFAHGGARELDVEAPLSRPFWEWLGFNYRAVDVDGSPDAIPLDLNFDPAPPAMVGRAALVTNCGTTEHIANQLNAFRVIHDLTATGGIMLHNLPAQGFLNHGLVNYNPKFFWSLSAANAYKWKYFNFQQLVDSPYGLASNIIEEMGKYDAESAERVKNYTFVDGSVFVVMQKMYDLPFVPPIDVRPGSETHNPVLKSRYWSVFDTEEYYKRLYEISGV